MAPSRQVSRGAPTTAGSQQLSEGDFSYDVHPFRFPSATGLTPKLVTGRATGGTPRDRQPLGLFSKNTALSSFGGKYGDSTQWLTPRGEVGGKSVQRLLCNCVPDPPRSFVGATCAAREPCAASERSN